MLPYISVSAFGKRNDPSISDIFNLHHSKDHSYGQGKQFKFQPRISKHKFQKPVNHH